MSAHEPHQIRTAVQKRYAEAARSSSCCGPASCGSSDDSDPFGQSQYDAAARGALPEEAVVASLGCGNPTALADLRPGDVVLDLGSGGGIDVLLSARRVAPGGKAYLVVQKNLGSDSLQRWIEADLGMPCARVASSKGFRVLEVRPA